MRSELLAPGTWSRLELVSNCGSAVGVVLRSLIRGLVTLNSSNSSGVERLCVWQRTLTVCCVSHRPLRQAAFKRDLDAARDAALVRTRDGAPLFIPPYAAANFTPYAAMPYSNRGGCHVPSPFPFSFFMRAYALLCARCALDDCLVAGRLIGFLSVFTPLFLSCKSPTLRILLRV